MAALLPPAFDRLNADEVEVNLLPLQVRSPEITRGLVWYRYILLPTLPHPHPFQILSEHVDRAGELPKTPGNLPRHGHDARRPPIEREDEPDRLLRRPHLRVPDLDIVHNKHSQPHTRRAPPYVLALEDRTMSVAPEGAERATPQLQLVKGNTTAAAKPSAAVAAGMRPTARERDVVADILPRGEVSILAGSSGAGKSTLLMQLLAAFQAGEHDFLGHVLDLDAKWGYIANDHAWKMYEETAARVGLDTSKLPHISLMDDDQIDLELFRRDSLAVLEQCLDRLIAAGCDTFVVDTLVSFFGSDIRQYTQNAYALLRLGRLARRRGITILGTHHTTKARTDTGFMRPQDRISGSSSLLGFSSTQLCLIPPGEAKDAVAGVTSFHIIAHNAPPKTIALTRDQERNGIFVPFSGGALEGPSAHEMEILEVIESAGEGVSVSRGYIAAALRERMSARTLDRALRALVSGGHITKSRHGEYKLLRAA